MNLDSLEKLFVHELKDLYSAEKQIAVALPKMSQAAHSPRLQKAFNHHLAETKTHIARIETIFEQLAFSPGGEHCTGAEGLIAEGEDMIEMEGDPKVKDAGLICAAQRIEHYEMAGYGCAVALANALGLSDAAQTLRQTLEEEGKTDRDLTYLAEKEILFQAAVA
ncbi:MAG: ferritin-like domain-containing protein [Verrucomicrobiales bacterium]|nr:ferritin-like domain-containing protein [Verrucomicrobiales bacterium]MCP5560525.1 ferritin-like domain-containing protein [Verrucomicrobiaceae bacterium]